MSTIKVNKLEQRSGCTATVGGGAGKTVTVDATTVTLGRCGGTVSLASGASQTGFGRTGTVNWCTTVKTSPFTATSGKGFFVNTTSGGVTVTLPSSPSAGDIVSVLDYANTSACNNITVGRGGSKIDGTCIDGTIDGNGEGVTLIFVDSTEGWKTVNTADKQIDTASYVEASGGNTTATCGDWKIHVFTANGCFQVTKAGNAGGWNKIDYLVIGGGGGGGGSDGGGGGAGGFRESSPSPGSDWTDSPLGNPGGALTASVATFPITVGAGGSAGGNGNNSVFSTITSALGGTAGANGGSGGGGNAPGGTGGTGNTPPVSPPQGNPGANGGTHPSFAGGGGGGGAGGTGSTPSPSNDIGGTGGAGVGTAIYSNPAVGRNAPSPQQPSPLRFFAGAGGGSGPATVGGGGGGDTCGAGGGSRRPGTAPNGDTNQVDGFANTGGGGAANAPGGPSSPGNQQGAGGSGIVILRYKFQGS
jgi:hypothetical protein